MANESVGSLETARLAAFLGPTLTVKRSGRDGAKYPLYLSTPLGPIHLNTRAAQELCLEHGDFYASAEARAAANAAAADDEPAPAPAPPGKKPARDLLEF